jgi:hypothetical protein
MGTHPARPFCLTHFLIPLDGLKKGELRRVGDYSSSALSHCAALPFLVDLLLPAGTVTLSFGYRSGHSSHGIISIASAMTFSHLGSLLEKVWVIVSRAPPYCLASEEKVIPFNLSSYFTHSINKWGSFGLGDFNIVTSKINPIGFFVKHKNTNRVVRLIFVALPKPCVFFCNVS